MLELTRSPHPINVTIREAKLVGKGQSGEARGCFKSPSLAATGEGLGSAGGESRVFEGICLLENLHPHLKGQLSSQRRSGMRRRRATQMMSLKPASLQAERWPLVTTLTSRIASDKITERFRNQLYQEEHTKYKAQRGWTQTVRLAGA